MASSNLKLHSSEFFVFLFNQQLDSDWYIIFLVAQNNLAVQQMKLVAKADMVNPVEEETVAADNVIVLEFNGIAFPVIKIIKAELIILRCFGNNH